MPMLCVKVKSLKPYKTEAMKKLLNKCLHTNMIEYNVLIKKRF